MLEFLIGLGCGFLLGLVAGVPAAIALLWLAKDGTAITSSPSATEVSTENPTFVPYLESIIDLRLQKTFPQNLRCMKSERDI